MEYQSLLNSIKRGVLSPLYLIYGEEDYLQDLLVQNLRSALVTKDMEAFNLDILDGEKVSPAQVVERAITFPVFAERRLVIVNNPSFFQTSKKEGDEKNSSPGIQVLLDYFENPLSTTCLVFLVKGGLDKRKKAVKDIIKKGVLIETPSLKGNHLNEWLQEEVRLLGKRIEPKALEYIILHTNHDLRHLKSELEKLDLYTADQKTISLELVEKLLTKTGEASIFVLIDSIGLRKGEEAILELRNLLEKGEAPVKVLFMITRQFRLILSAKDLAQQGYTEKQITTELAVHPFVAGKLLRQARNFSFQELESAMFLLLEGDYALKTSSGSKAIMENLILNLVGA